MEGHNGETSVTKNESDRLDVVCTVDSNPASLMTIELNGNIKLNQTGVYRLMYNKEELSCNDAGVYSCTGKNEYNRLDIASRNITVNVRCKCNKTF